jgi:hypothetical protein
MECLCIGLFAYDYMKMGSDQSMPRVIQKPKFCFSILVEVLSDHVGVGSYRIHILKICGLKFWNHVFIVYNCIGFGSGYLSNDKHFGYSISVMCT